MGRFFFYLLFLIFLSSCTKFAAIDKSFLNSSPDDESGETTPPIQQNSLSLDGLVVDSVTPTTLQLSIPYEGDDNNDSIVKFHFCSIKNQAVCDPMAGSVATFSKVGSNLSVNIDLTTTAVVAGDIIKYRLVSTDSDGLVGGGDQGHIRVPFNETSKSVHQMGYVTFGADASANDYVDGVYTDSNNNTYFVGTTLGALGEPHGSSDDIFVGKLSANGSLDTTFGENGIVQLSALTLSSAQTAYVEYGRAVTVDSSGHVYLTANSHYSDFGEADAGNYDALVIKLKPNGELDTTFSGDGIVHLGNSTVGSSGSGKDVVKAIALDSSNNILVAGETSGNLGETSAGGTDIFLFKLSPDGSLDTSFGGGDGIFQLGNTTSGGDATFDEVAAKNIVFDSSGNIFLAGYTTSGLATASAGEDAFVIKLSSSGNIDTSFASAGILQLGGAPIEYSGNDTVRAIAIDSADNLYITGSTNADMGESNGGSNDIYVAKITPAGNLDTSFSSTGIAQLGSVTVVSGDSSYSDSAKDIKVDSSGNVFVAAKTFGGSLGESRGGSAYDDDALIIKLKPDGTLDTDYSDDGIAQLGSVTMADSRALEDDEFKAMALYNDGTVVAVGDTSGRLGDEYGGQRDVFIAKFDTDGSLDINFSSDGLVQLGDKTIGVGASSEEDVRGIAMDSSGNILIAGDTRGSLGESNGESKDLFIAKYLASTSNLDPNFGNNGVLQLGKQTFGNKSRGDDVLKDFIIDPSGKMLLLVSTTSDMGDTNTGGHDVAVIKLNSDGTLDTSFSSDGIYQFGNSNLSGDSYSGSNARDFEIDNSGNIYIAGYSDGDYEETNGGSRDIIVLKLTSAGVPDNSFAGNGVLHLGDASLGTNADGSDRATAITVDINGNVYVTGYTNGNLDETNAGDDDIFVLKLTSAGILDNTFASNGILQLGASTFPAATAGDIPTAIIVNSSQEVFVSGGTYSSLGETNGGQNDGFVMKLTSAGALDTSFATNGIFQLGDVSTPGDANSYDMFMDLKFDASSKVVVTGKAESYVEEVGSSNDTVLLRLNTNGTLDNTFDSNGVVHFGQDTLGAENMSGNEYVEAMTIGPTGAIYLTGQTTSNLGDFHAGGEDPFFMIFNP